MAVDLFAASCLDGSGYREVLSRAEAEGWVKAGEADDAETGVFTQSWQPRSDDPSVRLTITRGIHIPAYKSAIVAEGRVVPRHPGSLIDGCEISFAGGKASEVTEFISQLQNPFTSAPFAEGNGTFRDKTPKEPGKVLHWRSWSNETGTRPDTDPDIRWSVTFAWDASNDDGLRRLTRIVVTFD